MRRALAVAALVLSGALLMSAGSITPSPTPPKPVVSNSGNVTVTNDGGSFGVYVDAGVAESDLRYAPGILQAGRQFGAEVHASVGSGFVGYGALTALATETGSVTGPNTNTDSIYTNYACTAVLNTTCGKQHTNVGTFNFTMLPRLTAVFKWPAAADITATRTWITMTATIITSDLPSIDFVGLRFKEGTDTNWQCCSGSSVATLYTCIDSGTPPTTGVRHVATLDFSSFSFFDAYMDGVRICHKSTALPSSTLLPGSTGQAKAQVNMTNLTGASTPSISVAGILFDRN